MSSMLAPSLASPTTSLPADALDTPTATSTLGVRLALGTVLVGAAAIHLALAPEHLGESPVLGAAFLASGAAQLALAGAAVLKPSDKVWWSALAVSTVCVVVWAVSRTIGLPLGGEAGMVEEVNVMDGACVAFEALAVFLTGTLLLLLPPAKR